MASLSWVKEKSEASTRKFAEAIQEHNTLCENYNELKSFADLKESENARLSKELKEVKAALSSREAEFRKVESKAEYYKDKSTSIKLFTTVKVRAELLKEYTEGRISSWDTKVTFSAWKKMKTLYSESEEEGDQ